MAKSVERRGRNGDPRIDGARQARREDILKVVSIRLVHEMQWDGPELEDLLKAIDDDDRLNDLLAYSLRCPDLFYFREALLPGSGSRAAKIDPRCAGRSSPSGFSDTSNPTNRANGMFWLGESPPDQRWPTAVDFVADHPTV